MKATGIVRRIDDLGRVVIPKEIRRTMRIREGDPLEIFTDREGEVIFKKYSPIGELSAFASQYAETLHKVCSLAVVITDRDAVIALSGLPRKDYAEKSLSPELERIISERSFYSKETNGTNIPVLAEGGNYFVSCAMPILTGGDIVGCVASVRTSDDPAQKNLPDEVESKLIMTAAGFLGKQLED